MTPPTQMRPPDDPRTNLRLVPPPPDDIESWKRLMNLLYLLEEDRLFEWAREVRAMVVRIERERAA